MENPKCPRCGGRAWRAGWYPRVSCGRVRRYLCSACGHTFLESQLDRRENDGKA